MALWQVYHPPGIFDNADSKAAFATDVTKLYTAVGLPAFYVVMQFTIIAPSNVYVGGVCKNKTFTPSIRIVIKNIPLPVQDETEKYRKTAYSIDAALKPHIYDKGWDCEYHVEEMERRLWKLNGLIPPEHLGEGHDTWVKENRPVPYAGAYWSPEKGRH